MIIFLIKIFNWLHNFSYQCLSSLALRYNQGIHPKHEILRYHEFFKSHIASRDAVLDVGCGNGYNTFQIAKKAKKVTGIDLSADNIASAKKHFARKNLCFMMGDATTYKFTDKYDQLVLSNVLEHIENRGLFLKKLHKLSKTLLFRVPLITRDWLPIYVKNLGLEYRLDKTHFIEYTFDSFREELQSAGWQLSEWSIQFGEIWAVSTDRKIL